eukprot:Plantae.Rhodophyta-Hildenbrandia_rubra.ctg25849.p1 GENE.Plantae.Rhodophyta-Hildenbrandia_rubra.ctg25849~~Plantae.Rhodophyta-Hildenbrandia_rubra.ctg25849.p1  ORF type:complete len:571 (-),score=138.86 Plantae.Rhodophyta-Hildenbrandia_rubra.ctg25849:1352-3064(-)
MMMKKLAKKNKVLHEETLEKRGAFGVMEKQRAQDKAERRGLELEVERLRYELDDCERKLKEAGAGAVVDEEEMEKRIDEVTREKDREIRELKRKHEEYRVDKDAEMKTIKDGLIDNAVAAREDSEFKELKRECEAHKKAFVETSGLVRELEKKLEQAEERCKTQSEGFMTLEHEVKILRITNQEQEKVVDSLQTQVQEGEAERRALHNQVMELKGNIRVFCRLRPILKSDHEDDGARTAPLFKSHTGGRGVGVEQPLALVKPSSQQQKWSFTFDRFFGDAESQTNVFGDVSDMVQSALDGYRVCIFAYGQTGSGKTHTMLGTRKDPGVIPRAMHQIFAHSERLKREGWEISLKASFLEIYNESVRDLLASKGDKKDEAKKYDVKFDPKSRESFVTNLTTTDVESKDEIDDLINQSMTNRATAATKSNDQSSRSHSVFRLRIEGKNQDEHFKGLLNLIDLAGSERLKVSGVQGTRQKEAVHINRSLSALGDVIAALANKDKHVPYRNSKLTYFLQDSLGGDSKTLMFVNLSPVHQSFNESLCSLRFAKKVNACEIGAASKNARVDLKSRVD